MFNQNRTRSTLLASPERNTTGGYGEKKRRGVGGRHGDGHESRSLLSVESTRFRMRTGRLSNRKDEENGCDVDLREREKESQGSNTGGKQRLSEQGNPPEEKKNERVK